MTADVLTYCVTKATWIMTPIMQGYCLLWRRIPITFAISVLRNDRKLIYILYFWKRNSAPQELNQYYSDTDITTGHLILGAPGTYSSSTAPGNTPGYKCFTCKQCNISKGLCNDVHITSCGRMVVGKQNLPQDPASRFVVLCFGTDRFHPYLSGGSGVVVGRGVVVVRLKPSRIIWVNRPHGSQRLLIL